MKVLVTGGAGFIGSHVVASLVERGHQVTVLDSLEKGWRQAVHPQADFIEGDLACADRVKEAFAIAAPDAVMHFAAYLEVGESMRDPGRFFRNNTANTLSLVEETLRQGCRRFIFSSTAATYGEPCYLPIDEVHPTVPTNAYGASKLLCDQALDWMARLQDLTCVSLRYFNAAGAGLGLGEDHRPETHLIPLLLEAALGQRPGISLYGTDYDTPDGTCVRDYIHVEDLALAHILALEGPLAGRRQVFNLGNGVGFSNREVISAVQRVTGHRIQVQEEARRPGDPPVLVASSDRIRRELGWVPRFPELDDIIRSAWSWKQAHPQGYGVKESPVR